MAHMSQTDEVVSTRMYLTSFVLPYCFYALVSSVTPILFSGTTMPKPQRILSRHSTDLNEHHQFIFRQKNLPDKLALTGAVDKYKNSIRQTTTLVKSMENSAESRHDPLFLDSRQDAILLQRTQFLKVPRPSSDSQHKWFTSTYPLLSHDLEHIFGSSASNPTIDVIVQDVFPLLLELHTEL